jgi:ribonuclease P protein component
VLHVAATETSSEPARVGFVVSRAVGTAVTRNLVKRRLREAVRVRVGDLPPGTLLVVRSNPAAATVTWPGLQRDLDVALGRALPVAAEATAPGPEDGALRGGS